MGIDEWEGGLQVKMSNGHISIRAITTNSDLLITYSAGVNQPATISVRPEFSPKVYCEHAFIFSTDPNALQLDHLRDKPMIAQREAMDRPVGGGRGFRYCSSRNYVSGRNAQVKDGALFLTCEHCASCLAVHVIYSVFNAANPNHRQRKGICPLFQLSLAA